MTEDRVRLLVAEALETHEEKLLSHLDGKFAGLEKMIKSAFPDGDPHGHRAAHEAQIKQAQGWQKLKSEIVSKFLTTGLWGAFLWVLYQGWQGLLHTVQTGHIPPK